MFQLNGPRVNMIWEIGWSENKFQNAVWKARGLKFANDYNNKIFVLQILKILRMLEVIEGQIHKYLINKI
jgi:hypothetical protein